MRKWKLIISLFFAGITFSFAQTQSGLSLEEFKAQSDTFIQQRDFEQALALAQKVAVNSLSEEDKITFYFQLKTIYAPPNITNFDSVIHYINKVLDITQSDSLKASQYFELGNMKLYTGQVPAAKENFQKALKGIEYLPTEMDSFRLFSRLALTSERPENKVKWLEKLNALALQSDNAKVQVLAYFDQLNYALKKADPEKSTDLLNKMKAVHYRLQDSVLISNVCKMAAQCTHSGQKKARTNRKHP